MQKLIVFVNDNTIRKDRHFIGVLLEVAISFEQTVLSQQVIARQDGDKLTVGEINELVKGCGNAAVCSALECYR